ncbi:UNVERIFIED_CONTAM: putative acyl-activating enzyme 19, partial [Sesamum calycinum]
SSGNPKGVCGTEIGLLNRFLWMQEAYPLHEGDVVLFKTAISFVDHMQEFLGAVLTTCFPRDGRLLLLVHFIDASEVTTPDFDLNLYGSTEVSGDCTYFDCKRLPLILEKEVLSSVPVGLPVSNCEVLLVGEDAPNEGEIYVSGLCAAAGYFHYPYLMPLADEDLSPEHDTRYPSGCGVQHYFKTGDFARKLSSGDLVFLGRKDRTLKVNGQRIALEEIESAFQDHPDVVDAAVLSREELGTWEASWDYDTKTHLLHQIVTFDFFWKVDYLSLAASTSSDQQARVNVDDIPQDHLLEVIKKVFSDALMVEKVSNDDDFFMMGGNSIAAAYVSFKLGIHMKLLYTFPTPLSLQMALSSTSSAIGTDGHLRMDLRWPEEMLLSRESRIPNFQGSKPHRRFFLADSNRDISNPPKKLKTESYTYEGPLQEQNSADTLWTPSAMHTECSFTRCNKSMHGGLCTEKYSYDTVWSNIIRRDGKGFMRELWKVEMDSCVDASPLLVFKGSALYVFIGSHSHKFVCVDGKSGVVQWETKLEGRVECSAAILDDFSQLDVTRESFISFTFQMAASAGVSKLMVRCGSYDQNLYAIDYKSYCCVYKLPCGGSIFGSPAINEMQEKLYVASTSGHVTTALDFKVLAFPASILVLKVFNTHVNLCLAREVIAIVSSYHYLKGLNLCGCAILPFKKLWEQDMGAPIFGSLSISYPDGNIICCLVDGTVLVLNTCGSIVWKVRTGGPIFAGPCTSQALPSQGTGYLIWKHAIGHPITSSAYVDENTQVLSNGSILSDRLICVCDSSGGIHVLTVDSNAVGGSKQNMRDIVQEFARLDLEGDIFSSPVMIGGRIFVGCRDDHVYCIKLDVDAYT